MKYSGKIKVLVIEDSLLFRDMVAKGIQLDNRIEVVGTAGNPYEARDKILETAPDVMTLDIEMPQMDGIEFLRQLMPQYPVPAVIVSCHGEKVMLALEAGAVDFVKKPVQNTKEIKDMFIQELIVKIKIASMANVSAYKSNYIDKIKGEGKTGSREYMIAMGASTGGTEAVSEIVTALPRNMPGIVVVQHMPEVFTRLYAERLNASCQMEVKEAKDGDMIIPGRILIAPGNFQTKVRKGDKGYYVRCSQGEKVNGHKPSVDVLFHSVAEAAGSKATGVILTGMGHDGAKGLEAMKKCGALTIGQDEESCVVYGMPKVAFDIGAVAEQIPLDGIAQRLYALVHA